MSVVCNQIRSRACEDYATSVCADVIAVIECARVAAVRSEAINTRQRGGAELNITHEDVLGGDEGFGGIIIVIVDQVGGLADEHNEASVGADSRPERLPVTASRAPGVCAHELRSASDHIANENVLKIAVNLVWRQIDSSCYKNHESAVVAHYTILNRHAPSAVISCIILSVSADGHPSGLSLAHIAHVVIRTSIEIA